MTINLHGLPELQAHMAGLTCPSCWSVTPVHEHIDLTPLLLGEVMEQRLSCCVSANSNGVHIDALVFQGL